MEDGHFIDDPLDVVGVKPDFSGMGLSKKIENAIIINGRVYELIDDSEENECDRCALVVDCNEYREPICVNVFTDSQGKRFKERTDL
jgi:hypothetical protein